jgi:predicted nucleic acid-binding protein
MGQRYLIDSNVIIDYAANLLPQKGIDLAESIFNTDFLTSVIVKIEVLGFADVPAKLSAMEEFLHTANILPLDNALTQKAILLRRKYKKLKLGDAIIAATAIMYELTLVSRNINDFKNIENLQLLDLHTF